MERAPAQSTSLSKFWDGRFRFYSAKKRYFAELVQSGFTVFQMDSDVIIQRNPWPVFRRVMQKCSLTVQSDGPIANAGMMLARPQSAETLKLLFDVAWRVQLFQHRPSVVKRVATFATPPFYANSDDQTILNDAIISAVTGNRTYLGAQARYEAKNSHNPFGKLIWTKLPEYEVHKKLISIVWRHQRRINSEGVHLSGFPYHRNQSDFICIAPQWLLGHLPDKSDRYVTHLAAARGMESKLKLLRGYNK